MEIVTGDLLPKGKSAPPRRPSLIKDTTSISDEPNFPVPALPYYANRQFDLYYPKRYPENGNALGEDGAMPKSCPITRDALDCIMDLDLTPVLDTVDVRKNEVFRTIKRLDEKLNSPVCRFLEAYQPDLPCSCEETSRLDAECPCPPVKEPMHFDIYERKFPRRCDIEDTQQKLSFGQRAGNQPSAFSTCNRDEIEKQVQALDEKLRSPEFHFLKPLEPEQIASCACETTNFPQAHCACPPMREPIDFRDKFEVQKKIKAMDDVLKSSDLGLSCEDKSKTIRRCSAGNTKPNGTYSKSPTKQTILKGPPTLSDPSASGRGPGSCSPHCPPPRCRCGRDCPARPGQFQKFPDRTFHVPQCPSDRGWMVQPRSPVQGTMACPFSPACCPIAEVCPFPVTALYDPSAPPLPPSDGPRRCPLVPTRLPSSALGDPSRPPCPLDPLKPPRGPPGCPLTSPASGCPMGQQSDCPLLTCSLGPLKSVIFDGNDKCPFCFAKCCPMISPDGPGCPMSINSTFCPLGNTDACCLKGMSSPPTFPPTAGGSVPGPKNEGESCPIGELLEANAKMSGYRYGKQQNSCPLTPSQPSPAVSSFPQSSCYCASSAAPNILGENRTRPDSCPLGGMRIPQPPAPPCPSTMNPDQRKQCPMTNLGDKNLDSSCPVSNMFECPALKKKPFSLSISTSKLKTPGSKTAISVTKLKSEDQMEQPLPQETTNIGKRRSTTDKSKKPQRKSSSPKLVKKGSTQKQKRSMEALERINSESVRKTDKEMTKTFSRMSNSTASNFTQSTVSTDMIFEVSLERLPKPPLSDSTLVKNAGLVKSRRCSSVREDVRLVKTSAPSDSKGFEQLEGKQKPKNCPIPDPEPCPLEVSKCPFGPPEPACPLAKVPNCPLGTGKGCCMTGMMLGSQKPECPTETIPCNMFPEGHCPMENLNMCECNYPISPCLEPLIPLEDAQADEQYCSRLNCCMGLPLPPIKPSLEFQTDTWYAYTDVKPGNPATKHYLEILDVPPEPEFFVSMNAFRKHPAWNILKYGEGYTECKKIKQILAARGPTATLGTQFVEDDLPDDEELKRVQELRKIAAATLENLQTQCLHTGEWTL